jgi:hypothetical protein
MSQNEMARLSRPMSSETRLGLARLRLASWATPISSQLASLKLFYSPTCTHTSLRSPPSKPRIWRYWKWWSFFRRISSSGNSQAKMIPFPCLISARLSCFISFFFAWVEIPASTFLRDLLIITKLSWFTWTRIQSFTLLSSPICVRRLWGFTPLSPYSSTFYFSTFTHQYLDCLSKPLWKNSTRNGSN